MTDFSEEKKSEDMPEMAIRVISHLYDAVADGAPYEPMFFAMDDVVEQVLGEAKIEESANALKPLFQPHFDRAAHVFDILSRKETETPLTFVERRTSPTAIVDQTGKILAANERFKSAFDYDADSLERILSSPADVSRFSNLSRSNALDSQCVLNAIVSKGGKTASMLAGHVASIEMEATNARALYVMLVQPQWNDAAGDLVANAFDLSPAEVEILESFVKSGSVNGVAEARGRSVRTVRTQLSRVFAQMGISGQTELALFLATLGGLQSEMVKRSVNTDGSGSQLGKVSSTLLSINGKKTEVIEYGHPKGKPILLLQSTHPPSLTEEIRIKAYEAKLKIVAPLKPGSGRSEFLNARPGPEYMAEVYAKIVEKLAMGKPVVAGQASGGLYALEFARQFQSIVQSVVLIDTGVPFRGQADLMRLPKNVRRTMVPARYFPDLLYLPHRLVASNFRRSSKGEASVVDYFFLGSPIERELTRTNLDAYNVTRSIIDYSFDDTDRLVQDVSRWASDWSGLLETVSNMKKVYFFHGKDNMMFGTDRIEEWVQNHPTCTFLEAASSGQLAAFEHPDELIALLKKATK